MGLYWIGIKGQAMNNFRIKDLTEHVEKFGEDTVINAIQKELEGEEFMHIFIDAPTQEKAINAFMNDICKPSHLQIAK